MFLKDSMRDLLGSLSFFTPSKQPVALARTWAKWEPVFKDIRPVPPKPFELEVVYSELLNHWKAQGRLDTAHYRLLKLAPWVIFCKPADDPGHLAQDTQFVAAYLKWIASGTSSIPLASLLIAFLRDYPSAINLFEYWRAGLEALLSQADSRRFSRLRHWREKTQLFKHLEQDGPLLFARGALSSDATITANAYLTEAGLTGELGQKGFMLHAYSEMIDETRSVLDRGQNAAEKLERLFAFSLHTKFDGSIDFRFMEQRAKLTDALLLPFANKKASEINEQPIRDFLLKWLGDPRIRSAGWIGVHENAKQVMLSWLVKASLEDFFEILNSTADPIWHYRREFWQKYLDGGFIDQAWVALGRNAAEIGRRVFKSNKQYARLVKADANQSVLLMRIGGLTIAEWSHNGKCRIWTHRSADSDRNAPILYWVEYEAIELRASSDEAYTHHGSAQNNWQSKVHNCVRNYTGIVIR